MAKKTLTQAKARLPAVPSRFRFTPALFAPDDAAYTGAFLDSPAKALYDLGFEALPARADEAGAFLHRIAEAFIGQLSRAPDVELLRSRVAVPLPPGLCAALLRDVPFAPGAEYVDAGWLEGVWEALRRCFALEVADYAGTVSLYLADKSQHLRVADKVFFHLVENPPSEADAEHPFSFMATYSSRDEDGRVLHMPLKYALTEYRDDGRRMRQLRSCLARASAAAPVAAAFLRKTELSRPLGLGAAEAYSLLKAIPALEDAGVVCRIPDWWKKKRHTLSVGVRLAGLEESLLGLDALVQAEGCLALDGQPLSDAEVQELLEQTDGLAFIKGRWVEVDRERLERLLAEVEACRGTVSLLDALRMNMNGTAGVAPGVAAGVAPDDGAEGEGAAEDAGVTNGDWLEGLLRSLRVPSAAPDALPSSFAATLRPYQQAGCAWLERMTRCGFGACLADDMGLGKTVQVLAYLETFRAGGAPGTRHALLIVPASLLGNWQKECAKFAPEMDVDVLHGSGGQAVAGVPRAFLTVTTYALAGRIPALLETEWDVVVLDEAQAIKNPLSKQAKGIKALPCRRRIALTGTPVENDLTNLWSLFDFLNRGLLGTSAEFKDFCRTLRDRPEGYAKLKGMISPFMLRRLKTDRSIIRDLPEKVEMVDYVALSKKQRVLYQQYVDGLDEKLARLGRDDPVRRRGLVLASLIKLKQICNHPDQFTGCEEYAEADSGKFALLRELCATIYEKRERVLVFTQFKEVCPHLDAFLRQVFGVSGFVLHGGTPVKRRDQMVEAFQGGRYVPYMVISVKAGGTGLTLTSANHVVHFDRWWNPAVENQATDRAFRIGQTRNVMVHKLVCRGTIEEKIDALIERKKELAGNVIGGGTGGAGEAWIAEMGDAELHRLFTLEA